MSTVYYSACHTCRVVGQLPKCTDPKEFHEIWIKEFGHEGHETECANEFDAEFEAKTDGKELGKYLGWGAFESKRIGAPYRKVDNETL